MTFQFPDAIIKHLEWISRHRRVSKKKAIEDAIATESFFLHAIERGDKILLFNKERDSMSEVNFREYKNDRTC